MILGKSEYLDSGVGGGGPVMTLEENTITGHQRRGQADLWGIQRLLEAGQVAGLVMGWGIEAWGWFVNRLPLGK